MIDKIPCPKCGKKTLEKIWNGFNPQTCPSCGEKGKQIEVTY